MVRVCVPISDLEMRAEKTKDFIMSKIIAALVALTFVTAAAAPSYAFGPNDLHASAVEK